MRAVLFDLDGTLLNLNIEEFFPRYLDQLSRKMAHLIAPEKFIKLLMQATRAMMENTDTSKTNKEVFIDSFFAPAELEVEKFYPLFDEFYERDFPQLNNGYGPVPGAHEALHAAWDKGFTLILATNPLFPRIAILERMRWAGVEKYPFALITSYEHMHSCKPQPQLFQEIITRQDLEPAESLMVGNDPYEDMIAGKLGIKTFLAEDYLVRRKENLEADYRGQLQEVVPLIKSL